MHTEENEDYFPQIYENYFPQIAQIYAELTRAISGRKMLYKSYFMILRKSARSAGKPCCYSA